MNPVDHPHGGRTKTNQPEMSPWGVQNIESQKQRIITQVLSLVSLYQLENLMYFLENLKKNQKILDVNQMGLKSLPMLNKSGGYDIQKAYLQGVNEHELMLDQYIDLIQIYENLNQKQRNVYMVISQLQVQLQFIQQSKQIIFENYNEKKNDYKQETGVQNQCYIDGFDKKKEITKKKKAQLKKNTFTLGFEPGFTLFYLRPNSSLSLKERNKIKIILNEEETKVKILQKKKKVVLKKKVEKKKKNSS
ncbi:hypothetical protein ABPG72_001056 [Tetrahymena utriculariae]